MAEYHFVSIWQISAPIGRVWEEVYRQGLARRLGAGLALPDAPSPGRRRASPR